RSKTPDESVLPRADEGRPTWTPFQHRRATEPELRAWFGNGARRNCGIVLGDASGGLLAIESDSADAEAWCAANLPSTPMMTRSPRGVHRFYLKPITMDAVPAHIEAGPLKIEIKREGQYLVAPDSVHPSGHVYQEIGEWPATLDSVPFLSPALLGNSDQRK